MRDPKLKLLEAIPLLSGLRGSALGEAARLLDVVEVEPGRELTVQGRVGREFFFLVDGTARVDIDGRQVATLGPGDVVGEVAMLHRGERTATVTAVTALRVLVGTPPAFTALIERHPDVGRAIRAAADSRLATG